MLETFIHSVEFLQGRLWSPFAFVGVYAFACLFFPISLFPVAGGILFGFWGGLICNLAAPLLGSSTAFFIARGAGRPWMERWFGDRLRRFESKFLGDYGFRSLLVLRLSGFPPFHLTNYLLGLSQVRFKTFVGASLVGFIPWTILMTYFAQALWKILLESGLGGFQTAIARQSRPIMAGCLLFAAIIAVSIYFRRKQKISG